MTDKLKKNNINNDTIKNEGSNINTRSSDEEETVDDLQIDIGPETALLLP